MTHTRYCIGDGRVMCGVRPRSPKRPRPAVVLAPAVRCPRCVEKRMAYAAQKVRLQRAYRERLRARQSGSTSVGQIVSPPSSL
jgi:hypothetical protein